MSKKIITLLLALSLGLNIGVIATTLVQRTAEPPPGQGPGPGGGGRQPAHPARLVDNHLKGMTQHLDLDQEQQDAIRSIMTRHMGELSVLRIAAEEAGRNLSEVYGAQAFDPEHFLRLVHQTSAARARLDSLSSVMLVAEAAVLTTEQRIKFSKVATTVHTNPQKPNRDGGPPPRDGGPPPRGGGPRPR